jgi:hypothetical protein
VLHFEWDLPAVLLDLLTAARAEPLPPSPPEAPRRQITLLFARSPRGRVTVMRWNPVLETLANALEGVEIAAALVDAGVVELRRASSATRRPSAEIRAAP